MNEQLLRKEQEILRTIYTKSGTYDREAFGDTLGLSKFSVDKTRASVMTMLRELELEPLPEPDGKRMKRLPHSLKAGIALCQLYRMKPLTDWQIIRYYCLIKIIQHAEQSGSLIGRTEIIQRLSEAVTHPKDQNAARTIEDFKILYHRLPISLQDSVDRQPDPDAVLADLQALRDCGLLLTETGKRRKVLYRINYVWQPFSQQELLELHDFILKRAAEQPLSAAGLLLEQCISDYLIYQLDIPVAQMETIDIQFANYGKLLDEHAVYSLLQLIHERRSMKLQYFSVITGKKSSSANSADPDLQQVEGIPLRIVYDHRFTRWYLVGWSIREQTFIKLRLDYIMNWTAGDIHEEQAWNALQTECARQLATAWLVDTSEPTRIRARFYFNSDGLQPSNNFILRRVQEEAAEAVITIENDQSFLLELVVNGITEIKPWIMSFGSSIEVLEPLELRNSVIKDWEVMVSRYESL